MHNLQYIYLQKHCHFVVLAEIPSGCIVGTNNVFWRKFIDPDTKTFKSPQEIQEGG